MSSIIMYSVEEVEGKDGSVSTEFETLEEAQDHFSKLENNPPKFTTGLRLWVNIMINGAEF